MVKKNQKKENPKNRKKEKSKKKIEKGKSKKIKKRKIKKNQKKEKEFVFNSPGQNMCLLSLPYSWFSAISKEGQL